MILSLVPYVAIDEHKSVCSTGLAASRVLDVVLKEMQILCNLENLGPGRVGCEEFNGVRQTGLATEVGIDS